VKEMKVPPQPSPMPTEPQLELLAFLIKHIEEHGYQPTQSEMALQFGVTKNAIQNRLKEFAKWDLIQMPKGEKTKERGTKINHVKFKAYSTKGK
jgi:SOS-response transcriptional repressor LexA